MCDGIFMGQRLVQDVVEPNGTMEVKVFIQHSKDLTPAIIGDCRDKFLIQSTPVPADWVRRTPLLHPSRAHLNSLCFVWTSLGMRAIKASRGAPECAACPSLEPIR